MVGAYGQQQQQQQQYLQYPQNHQLQYQQLQQHAVHIGKAVGARAAAASPALGGVVMGSGFGPTHGQAGAPAASMMMQDRSALMHLEDNSRVMTSPLQRA
mmetsp:Transcript_121870/g.306651  ORF Transcript_121870/g.306651 Transcript_121870/m.306651 type:complete len:100 (+) Transcript_121870:466-765(+)